MEHDNVISLVGRVAPAPIPPAAPPPSRLPGQRVDEICEVKGTLVRVREAREGDIPAIQALYHRIYQGKYTLEFATQPERLKSQIEKTDQYLLLVAEDEPSGVLVGSINFGIDPQHRLGRASGIVVSPEYRGGGLGSRLLGAGVEYLTEHSVDVLYATSRTVGEAPSRITAEAGFHQVGLFPNAVQVDNMEHLNLDVYLTPKALPLRRRRPFVFKPYHETFDICRKRLGLERAQVVSEYTPLALNPNAMEFEVIADAQAAQSRFRELEAENRLANSFFPFHSPNLWLKSAQEPTEVFVSLQGRHKQAAILGYRTDRVNIQDLLHSVALALHRHGAAYVEFLVDAHDYRLQQQAYTARFIPSAYFPAMRLGQDGLRDDVIVVSRTFSLLDFTGSVMKGDNLKYLRSYLRHYQELYIRPILGK